MASGKPSTGDPAGWFRPHEEVIFAPPRPVGFRFRRDHAREIDRPFHDESLVQIEGLVDQGQRTAALRRGLRLSQVDRMNLELLVLLPPAIPEVLAVGFHELEGRHMVAARFVFREGPDDGLG